VSPAALVVAHYDENLDWLARVPEHFVPVVVSKTNRQYLFQLVNKGNEASAYLFYIIRFYEQLPEHCVFVHGHRASWHHHDTIDAILRSLTLTDGFATLNHGLNVLAPDGEAMALLRAHARLFDPPVAIPERLISSYGAQFQVHRSLIQRHPRAYYARQLEFLETTDMDSLYSGRLFEWMWFSVFTGEYDEQAYRARRAATAFATSTAATTATATTTTVAAATAAAETTGINAAEAVGVAGTGVACPK
jgi:hypothetical protein